jgi:hypothetical protein
LKPKNKKTNNPNKQHQLVRPFPIIMKLSISLLFAVALSSNNNNNAVIGETAVDANGNPCQELDTNCSNEINVPDAPSICKGDEKTTDSCSVACIINGISYKCENGVFVVGDVGSGFTDPPATAPAAGCDGTPAGCSGPAVIDGTAAVTISKDSDESDVDSIELESAGTTAYSTIVSSIVGFTAVAGVVALL